MNALDKLIAQAEQELGTPKRVTDTLSTLSAREIRRRFDEYGDPRPGFDVDGNPVSGRTDDDESPRVRAVRDRAEGRRS